MCGNGVGILTTQAAVMYVAVAGMASTRHSSVLYLTGTSTAPIIATAAAVSVWCVR